MLIMLTVEREALLCLQHTQEATSSRDLLDIQLFMQLEHHSHATGTPNPTCSTEVQLVRITGPINPALSHTTEAIARSKEDYLSHLVPTCSCCCLV